MPHIPIHSKSKARLFPRKSIPRISRNPDIPHSISAFVNILVAPVGIEPTLSVKICLIKTVPNHSAKGQVFGNLYWSLTSLICFADIRLDARPISYYKSINLLDLRIFSLAGKYCKLLTMCSPHTSAPLSGMI